MAMRDGKKMSGNYKGRRGVGGDRTQGRTEKRGRGGEPEMKAEKGGR